MSAPLPASGTLAPITRAPADVLRVVLAYAVFASLWILVSDTVVHLLVSDPARMSLVSTIKGGLFVAVTSLLLYSLIRRLRDLALAGAREELAAQAEKARALQLLAAIADNSSDAIFAKDLQGRYRMVNRAVERVVGKTAEEMLGQDDTFLFPAQAETIRANDRRVMDQNRIDSLEETVATAAGERIFLATKGPLHDAQGQVSGIFGISRDITERHLAAQQLAEIEAQRAAEMTAALEAQNRARLAALNLMEDAVAAREHAESLSGTLAAQLDELRRWQQAMLGREDRILSIKKEVNDLLAAQGQPLRYASVQEKGEQ